MKPLDTVYCLRNSGEHWFMTTERVQRVAGEDILFRDYRWAKACDVFADHDEGYREAHKRDARDFPPRAGYVRSTPPVIASPTPKEPERES